MTASSSNPVGKGFRNYHFILTSEKLNELKTVYSGVFRGTGVTSKPLLQPWETGRQITIYRSRHPPLQDSGPAQESLICYLSPTAWGTGRTGPWRKNTGKWVVFANVFVKLTSWSSSWLWQWGWEKVPSCIGQGKIKGSILKQTTEAWYLDCLFEFLVFIFEKNHCYSARAGLKLLACLSQPQCWDFKHTVLGPVRAAYFTQGCLQKELFHQSLTCWGFVGVLSGWERGIPNTIPPSSASPKAEWRNLRNICEVHSQWA